jgi:hypothetical protein
MRDEIGNAKACLIGTSFSPEPTATAGSTLCDSQEPKCPVRKGEDLSLAKFPVFSRRCAKKARKSLRIFGAMF